MSHKNTMVDSPAPQHARMVVGLTMNRECTTYHFPKWLTPCRVDCRHRGDRLDCGSAINRAAYQEKGEGHMSTLSKGSLMFGVGLLVGAFKAFVLMVMWNWFVLPVFHT